MNLLKVAQAFRLLADAMEETAARFEDSPAAAMAEKMTPEKKPEPEPEKKPEPEPEKKPEPKPEPKLEPKPEPKLEPTPTMTQKEFTTAMQKIGREFGTNTLHAILPAVWAKYTDGVARMSAIKPEQYAEIVEFTRKEVEKQA